MTAIAVTRPSSLTERLVNAIARRSERRAPKTTRRGFIGGAALVGAALAVDPWGYLTRPASALATICGADSTCGAGYTVFCCTINAGRNACPPDSFIGGWWKADNSSFCGGSARYYVDCNAFRDGRYKCHCNPTTCDQRRVACNQFRYGQCNTQIPWTSTGPVLCRLVSCTPPWVQYGGTCSSSSATDNNTATHSAPCVVARSPRGTIDNVATTGNLVRVTGWAYDPDQPSASIRVALYRDGRALTVISANQPRPSVNAALHITGNHGFSIPFNASNGVHQIKVYAVNVGSGSNTVIGTRSVNVNPGSPPRGHVEPISRVGHIVHLTGWAYDRDVPGSPVRIVVYQDGHALTVVSTTVQRDDVNRAFAITGTHGFSVHVNATPGLHKYRMYAMNLGRGQGNPLIGGHDIFIPAAAAPAAAAIPAATSPAGQLDAVTSSGTTVRLTGWAYDPDQPGTEIPVAVYEDGRILHWYPTGVARPDVNAAHGLSGKHGFDITLSVGTGVHSFTVHAVDGAANPVLGSRSVAVNQTAPLGQVEHVTVLGRTVRITGWALDPDRPGTEIPVIVYRDGVALSRHPTSVARPDINRSYGAGGAHGFDVTVDATPGKHTFTVYAADVGAGRPDSLIGGQTVELEAAPATRPSVTSS
jgi:hypothetical protein